MSTHTHTHTPEPWLMIKDGNTAFYGATTEGCSWYLFEAALEKNAKRIVLSVNACRELSNEQLQNDDIVKLREDCEKLKQAMEQILKDSQELPHINEIARKALEKGSKA